MTIIEVPFIVTDIVLVDVVDFSLLSDEQQFGAAIMFTNTLHETVSALCAAGFREPSEIVIGFIPTGDGFYVILNPLIAGYGPFLALSLRSAILRDGRATGIGLAGVRCAVHLGTAVPFPDVNQQKNFVGTGLNTCARFLSDPNTRPAFEAFAGDTSFMVISDQALANFEKSYPTKNAESWFGANQWRVGDATTITDKHKIQHAVRPFEASRLAAIAPHLPSNWQERAKSPSRTGSPPSGGHRGGRTP